MLWVVRWGWPLMKPEFSSASSIQAKVLLSGPREPKQIECFIGKQSVSVSRINLIFVSCSRRWMI